MSPDHTMALPMLGSIDCSLAAIHRELKFIARTLARLRHRHHAALVFSSKRSSQQTYITTVQERLSQDYTIMLRKIFGTPKKASFDDIESCPSTPLEEVAPPLCLTPGYRTPSATLSPVTSPSPRTPTRKLQKRPPLRASVSAVETITVIVDEQSQAIFDVPRRYLSGLLATHEPETIIIRDRGTDGETTVTGIFLRKINCTDFADFVQWTKTSRILPYPHNNIDWVIEHHARRLVDALALGVAINSVEYQCAAVSELHILGPLLVWPEDYVNIVFAATSSFQHDDHPARQLIVGIVAAKTCGTGKRRVRQGARDRNVERGDRISSTTFWKMYDAYCAEYGPECGYPEARW